MASLSLTSLSLLPPRGLASSRHVSSSSSLSASSFLSPSLSLLSRSLFPSSSPPSSSSSSSLRIFAAASSFDEEEEENDDDIAAAYEALYGKPFVGLGEDDASDWSLKMTDADEADDDQKETKRRPSRRGPRRETSAESGDAADADSGEGYGDREGGRDREGGGFRRNSKDNLEERLIQVRRVTKVVKGGKQLSFRTVVVVGDLKGKVGVGVGKAKEVIVAVQKAGADARRHMVKVPLNKYLTFPHRFDGRFGAAKVMLRPAATGTGVIAGGTVRTVLELAGVENALGKELGSGNPLNNARAVLDAVSNMKTWEEVAKARGMEVAELRGGGKKRE